MPDNENFPRAMPSQPPTRTRDVIQVSELNHAIAGVLERSFPLAWVRGEISNFTRAASGHWYFSLKDARAQIRCVMFRGRNQHVDFSPREGEAVEVRALVSMYEARGELQLGVEAMRRAGLGNLYEAFLRLKEKLAQAGLFDTERKRPIPDHPRVIGVVTSLQAAAMRDVLTTLQRRAPHVPVIVYPVPVQGAGAAEKIAAMLDTASARRECDVLILCRGGGSIEDLWSFNEEVVAHAIARCAVPVVSGVGHETDFTIADFVADVRAPTPTGAAELVSPDRAHLLQATRRARDALAQAMDRQLERRAQHLEWLGRRLRSPQAQLQERRAQVDNLARHMRSALRDTVAVQRHRVDVLAMRWRACKPDIGAAQAELGRLAARMAAAAARRHERETARLARASGALELLAPQRTLERGYAVLLDNRGRALRSPVELRAGSIVEAHLADGVADIEIAGVQAKLASF
ncbi:exodeoxyribonuclease VII large subunit [Cupriavidus metallidurans]|jgi:exodeoxyribonuclease VII large subunit|nr:exodeoxyribonuclease VII large subunit [Cupriavidus metallidurans]AVA32671.1 exodeoxyribonuclease VII large subunit [Cupriavidus metallidurans]MDE4916835.1 exodeoxyribonuclease VII large subunit [Cupriavidus metallidurans]QGS28245.1 exodeoxyribonuclease VII large subunit [Cupriavidus metallidurans]